VRDVTQDARSSASCARTESTHAKTTRAASTTTRRMTRTPRTCGSLVCACAHRSAMRSKRATGASRRSDDRETFAVPAPKTVQRHQTRRAGKTAVGARLPAAHRARLQRLRSRRRGRRPRVHGQTPRVRQTRGQARYRHSRLPSASLLPVDLRRAQLRRTSLRATRASFVRGAQGRGHIMLAARARCTRATVFAWRSTRRNSESP